MLTFYREFFLMFSRRAALIGLGSATISKTAFAGLACQDYPTFRRCTVGVDVLVGTARQEYQHWCWAACIQAVFAIAGYKVGQRRIVEKVFGMDVDRAAAGPQIVTAVDGQWIDDNNRSFEADATVLWDSQYSFGRPDAVLQAARELEKGRPLIVGALGHATLLTAMSYAGDGFNVVRLEQLVVRDPWPGNPNRRVLSLQEALGTQFLTQVNVL
jgi:hypothetical protein